MRLALVALDSSDARVVRRIVGLSANGVEVLGLSFHRDRGALTPPEGVTHIDLGRTYDRRYLQRAWAIARATIVMFRHRRKLAKADVLYAINFDNALLAAFVWRLIGGRQHLVMEVADVQPAMIGDGVVARVFRGLERMALRRSALLVTSSIAFDDNYFRPLQHWVGETFLLENKVYPHRPQPQTAKRRPHGGPPWVIGYFGAFRDRTSWLMIRRIAADCDGQVTFRLSGFPTFTDEPTFRSEVDATPFVEYTGPYNYAEDLSRLYSSVHMSWCFDFESPTANSRWLLPNRLYESGLFGVPMLSEDGTATGDKVRELGAGWVLEGDIEAELTTLLRHLQPEDWSRRAAELASLPREVFDGEGDYLRLADTLRGLVADAGPDDTRNRR